MHPPGTIIVPNPGSMRYTQTVADLFAVHKPAGTHVAFPVSGSVVQNLNRSLLEMVGEWAWLQSDDHAFPADLLLRLLDHELDVVVPMVLRRNGTGELVFGDEVEDVDPHSGRSYPAYRSTNVGDIPSTTDPFKVEISGTGGMLVRKRVLEAIGFPYFETTDGLKLNEDIVFSKKVRAAGFDIWVDPTARMGHITALTAWPY